MVVTKEFQIIVARDANHGIGVDNDIPWQSSKDMAHFKQVTTTTEKMGAKNAVIMGRKTWESLPERFRPLPGRLNCVLTRQSDFALPEDVFSFSSLDACLDSVSDRADIDAVFVIGGAQLYKEALGHKNLKGIYLTQLKESFPCDRFFEFEEDHFEMIEQSALIQDKAVSLQFFCFAKT